MTQDDAATRGQRKRCRQRIGHAALVGQQPEAGQLPPLAVAR
jgi:hypothetical protein